MPVRPERELTPDARARRSRRSLRSSRAIFDRLERAVARCAARGRLERGAAIAAIAAAFAAEAHPGRFASLPIERVLPVLGRGLPAAPPSGAISPHDPGGRERVLHVLTRPEVPGGHTNWLTRWIESDPARVHHLAVLDQRRKAVPERLATLVSLSGGDVVDLTAAGGVLERAGALRALATDGEFDAVVLAVHPQDLTAALALAGIGDRPPVISLDHADHLFWLGLGVTDVLVEFREVGARWSREHRGYPASRQALVPLPAPAPAAADRAAARRALALGEDDFVVLSIGSAFKYRPADGPGFLERVRPALAQVPGAVLVAVGPEPRGEWSVSAPPSAGRVRAVGRQLDLAPYLAAADAYINSYPIGSTLALLEAAAAGLPILSFRPSGPDRALLEDDPACPDGVLALEGPTELAAALEALAGDAAARAARGDAARLHIEHVHGGESWSAGVQRCYQLLRAVPPMTAAELTVPPAAADSVDETLAGLGNPSPWRALLSCMASGRAGLGPPLEPLLALVAGALRARAVLRGRSRGGGPSGRTEPV